MVLFAGMIVAVVLILVVAAAFTDSNMERARARDAASASADGCLVLTSHRAQKSGGLTTISGVITNTCDRSFGETTARFRLLDGDRLVGHATAFIHAIRAREQWDFTAQGPDRGGRYELDLIEPR